MIDARNLPDFKTPPAIETLMGLYFAPLKGWQTPYFGLFWNEIRQDYPKVEVQPFLVPDQALRVELKSEKARLEITGEVPVRWLYFHRSEKTLIQVQSDTFMQNWRKRNDKDPYLHYSDLRPSFANMWKRYCKFLRINKVTVPVVRECEVTYVNHIDKGSGWNSLRDLSNVVSCWSSVTSSGFLPSPDIISFNLVYPIRKKNGRLQVTLQPGIREGQETLQLTLMAKCKPESSAPSELLNALDLAREWVVRGFTDFTTGSMHEIWGKTDRQKRGKK
ncbi:MAG TPA: TIGR04255 family protein [Candidatus Angelobacter sp.]|nr:TIGR04255 family protein [Candidatus Angelobacter sp.]